MWELAPTQAWLPHLTEYNLSGLATAQSGTL